MHFPLGMLKGIFTLNDIKIDLADRSKPKSKVTVSKNLLQFYLKSFLKDNMLPYCQQSLYLNLRGWLITTFDGANQEGVLFSNDEFQIDY